MSATVDYRNWITQQRKLEVYRAMVHSGARSRARSQGGRTGEFGVPSGECGREYRYGRLPTMVATIRPSRIPAPPWLYHVLEAFIFTPGML